MYSNRHIMKMVIPVSLFLAGTLGAAERPDLGPLDFNYYKVVSSLDAFDESIHTGLSLTLAEYLSISDSEKFMKINSLRLRGDGDLLPSAVFASFSNFIDLNELILVNFDLDEEHVGNLMINDLGLYSISLFICDLSGVKEWPEINPKFLKLQIVGCGLKSVPYIFLENQSLKSVSFSDNNIEELSLDLRKMTSLEYLSFAGCGVERVSEDFRLSNSVNVLDLRFNKLDAIPNHFAQFRTVDFIDLTFNKITIIPEWLDDYLYGTEAKLNLSGNQIVKIPDFVWDYCGRLSLQDNVFSK